VMSALVGLRYLTPQDTTFILEYYYNGPGFTRQEFSDFFTFVDASYSTFVRTGNASGLQRAALLAAGAYGRPNPMRHYVYGRASHKEPWHILYFTPALTTIVNVVDRSFGLIPELLYSPRTNLELRLRGRRVRRRLGNRIWRKAERLPPGSAGALLLSVVTVSLQQGYGFGLPPAA